MLLFLPTCICYYPWPPQANSKHSDGSKQGLQRRRNRYQVLGFSENWGLGIEKKLLKVPHQGKGSGLSSVNI